MRMAVRLVALMLAGLGLLPLFAALVVLANVGRFRAVTAFTITKLLVDALGSPVAAIQLWRCKSSGWVLGVAIFAIDLLFQQESCLRFLQRRVLVCVAEENVKSMAAGFLFHTSSDVGEKGIGNIGDH